MPPDLQTPASHDDQLAAILGELLEAQKRGETVDIEAVIRIHPELAADLRELWTTAMLANDLAQLASVNGQPGGEIDSALAPTINHTPSHPSEVGVGAPAAPGAFPRDFGDYVLLAELGRGGMGVVYQARQKGLDRLVALKMILRGATATPADLARFRAEAENAARLEHPHIVPVYDVGEVDGQPYFSMKYVEGQTLSQLLAEGPLSAREAAEMLLPVTQAIAEAHRQGVLHRDLKPSNILIDPSGRPLVTDFGLAKRLSAEDSLTRTGAIIGTPSYMAPEQAAGRRGDVSPASDVYSLGTILYQMLVGRPPFQAPTPVDTVLMVLEQEPLPPRLLNPRADADLEMIALKCLQKPQDLRYADAGALANDLQAYLEGNPISARSGAFRQVVGRLFRETHHAAVLENWGLLWMWHSLVVLVLCLITNYIHFHWKSDASRWVYAGVWTLGLGVWSAIFWQLRQRAGPITFVERQIAHVWGMSVISSSLLYVVETLLGLPVLSLSPVLGLISGSVFFVKAGILSGVFYLQAAALYAATIPMAIWPEYGLTIFGLVSAVCFFVPGLKYYRQSQAA